MSLSPKVALLKKLLKIEYDPNHIGYQTGAVRQGSHFAEENAAWGSKMLRQRQHGLPEEDDNGIEEKDL